MFQRNIMRSVWFLLFAFLSMESMAFSMQRQDNLAVYWGQDSAGSQQRLGFYCNDDTIDTIPLAFLYIFFGKGGQPVIDFANICSTGSGTFQGTDLADCSLMASDIEKCQANGKIVTLSLGGADANVGFNSPSQAAGFAKTIWNMFLGGNGPIRPLGSAVLDGIDLDIENGSSAFYDVFVNTLRSLAVGSTKRYYVTAAPQCPFPDAKVGEALNNAFFDAVYVQFYNNFCETSAPSEFNFATWDQWAKTRSPNKNVKVYLGAPASAQAAGSGYVSSQTLIDVALDAQNQFSSFGGVMLWDADTAYRNNQYHVTVKNAISNGGNNPGGPIPSNPVPTFNPGTIPGNTNPTGPTATQNSPPTAPTTTQPGASTTTSLGDPRASGRVRRPHFSALAQAANEGQDSLLGSRSTAPSRFFKF